MESASVMANDWQNYVGYIGGVRGTMDNDLGIDGIIGPDSEYGYMTVEDFSGFGNLYKYDLSHKSEKTKQWGLKATKYAIPVIGKKGDFKVWKGDTIEAVIKQYENGVAKGGDAETTFTSQDQADKYLKEKHGFLGTEIWHVTKLTDLGPVSKTAPPAQVTSPTITQAPAPTMIEAGQQAIEAGKTEQQVMAVEKALSPTTIGKNLTTAMWVGVGLVIVAIVGGVIYFGVKATPAGQAGSLMEGISRKLKR